MSKEGKQKIKKKIQKNREITKISISFVLIFMVMMGYFLVYSVTHEEELINNSYNNRQQILVAQNSRGTIYARNGEVLAETEINSEGKEKRNYPYKNLFAHSVGYVDKGKTGIEAVENYYLIQSGISEVDKVKNELAGKKNPGNNVYTTLDVSLQEIADKALGIYKGAIIAMNPKTGEILAMVSKPDFDPNLIAEQWDDLLEDEESGVLLNRATQGLYPPGSTFKIITTLEYLRENPDTFDDYRFHCVGKIRDGEDVINCYHGSQHGDVDLKKSFAKSCNSSYANIGLSLNRTSFSSTLHELLFNQELPVSFAYHPSKLIISAESSNETMMQSAIGQGKTQITPLHLSMITAAIANNGVLMKPQLVSKVESAQGAKIKNYAPEKCGSIMTEEECRILTQYMEEVIENGTGTKLSGLSYTAAGKTGSAEYNSNKEESHAWFTGFAPVEDPQLVVTVIIESAGSGGDYAVPTAKMLFDAYLKE